MTDKDMIDRLLRHFWIDDGRIIWSYKEDYPVDDFDPELALAMKQYIIVNRIKCE